jgi:GNAT superfamily N-acetyltransferase
MGRNKRALLEGAGYSFEYSGDEYTHRVTASHSGDAVGVLKWQAQDVAGHQPMKKGEVSGYDVLPEHRLKGVATAMWDHAHEVASSNPDVPKPMHSKMRTLAGDALAKKLSPKEYTPPERIL